MIGKDTPREHRVLVRKYGGSSLASVARIRAVAADIRAAREEGFRVVVVVSAMGKTTDELAELARQAHPAPPRRELDMLLSVGERITMSLLSMALDAEGCPAISFTGSQCGIITDTSHTDARILEVKGDRVREALKTGCTVVVAGFQGVSREREITTLGRGGSDTTAVALAAALGAVRCEILKDVDGIMTADPAEVDTAERHESLDWDQMRQVAASGCGVVHIRAVEYAAQHNVPLVVRSSFHDGPGTRISHGEAIDGAAVCPPCQRPSRYRPLVMNVDRGLDRLRVVTDDPALARRCRDVVLGRLDPADTVAEWLDAGQGFRWEALGTAAPLKDLETALAELGHGTDLTLTRQEDITCISLAGGRPDSWLEVERHVADVLDGLGVDQWRLRADGSALRVILPGTPAAGLPARIHQALLAD